MAEHKQRSAIVEGGKLLHDEVPSPAAFAQAQALGLRSDGVYWQNDIGTIERSEIARLGKQRGAFTNYLRFCEDGSVVSALTSGLPKDIRNWLTCEPLDPHYSHGVIAVEGRTIRFRLHMTTGTIDYWGAVKPAKNGEPSYLDLNEHSNIKIAETFGQTHREHYEFYQW